MAEFGQPPSPDRQGALADSRNSGVPRTEVAKRGAIPIRFRGLALTARPGGNGSSPFLVRTLRGVASMPLLPMSYGVGGAFGWNMDEGDGGVMGPTLRELLAAANAEYGYSDEDKEIVRRMAKDDRGGLMRALLCDPLVMARVRAL